MPDSGEKLVSVYVKVKAGLSSENIYAGSGITHFIEHMIFKGTHDMGVGVLASKVKSLGGRINASTSLDTTTFHITLPSEHLKEAVDLLSEAVMNPAFDAKEFEKEREVIKNEMRLHEDDPSRRINMILFETAYTRHPYRFPIIGYRGLVDDLTREDLVRFHGMYYIPNNMVVSIAGNFDDDVAKKAVEDSFGKYDRKKYPVVTGQTEPEQITRRTRTVYQEINLGYFAIGFHSTGILNKDLYAIDVMASVLGYGGGSRLNTAVVKERELLYSIGAYNYTPLYPGLFIINGIGNPEKLKESITAVWKELEKLKNGGITEEEYQRAKKMVTAAYYRSMETVDSKAGYAAQGQMFTGDPEFSKKYVEGIERVKINDIRAAANRYLNENSSSIVYILPERYKKANESSGSSGDEEEKDGKIGPKKYVLSNGIRVIFERRRHIPMVSLTFNYLGGVRAQKEDEDGLSNLTQSMLLKGTKKRSEKELSPAMEKRGGSISSSIGMNASDINMEFFTKDTDYALDMLKEVLKEPTFPQEEIDKMKERIKAAIKREDDSSFSRGVQALRKGIYKDHPYSKRILGSAEAVDKYRREDLIEFHFRQLAPKNICIGVVGSFDPDIMIQKLEKRLSFLDEREFDVTTPAIIPLQEVEEEVIEMPKKEAVFLLGFNGVDAYNEDKYALEVIFSIMSGMSGRLFDSIREAFGLSYAQGGRSVSGMDPGYCVFYVAARKSDLDKAKDILIEEIKLIKTQEVTDTELESAKNELIASRMMAWQTNGSRASRMTQYELYGLGFDYYTKFESEITSVNKEDIMNAANKYFDLERSYRVEIIPLQDER